MTFIDFTGFAAGRNASIGHSVACPTLLSKLEIEAMQVGQRDSLSTIRRHGRLSNLVRSAFGLWSAPPLADPTLEAVRRLSVAARHGDAGLIESSRGEALAAGISAFKVGAVLDWFELSMNTNRGRRTGWDRFVQKVSPQPPASGRPSPSSIRHTRV